MKAGADSEPTASATSAATRGRLGWSPREVGLLADLARGGYFRE